MKLESHNNSEQQQQQQPQTGAPSAAANQSDNNPNRLNNSMILLAAAASKECRVPEEGDEDDSQGGETIETQHSSSSSGPLKKRKTVVDILRPKSQAPPAAEGVAHEGALHDNHAVAAADDDPYHVSPMSHGSKTTVAAADSPPNSDGLSSTTSRALSYESKEETKTHTTTATSNAASNSNTKSKSGTTNNTSPKSATQFPSHSLVPYFPSALHWLLTESSSQTASPEYAAARSVLQWVPHGQALRVVRWDALRSQVLPQFFPQLVASVDAFLWHLAAWGFEEIPDGPDVGAFGHTVRVGLSVCLRDADSLRARSPSCCSSSSSHIVYMDHLFFFLLVAALSSWAPTTLSGNEVCARECRSGEQGRRLALHIARSVSRHGGIQRCPIRWV